jgi:formylglycine-generating enzyme required for sulfatase activity
MKARKITAILTIVALVALAFSACRSPTGGNDSKPAAVTIAAIPGITPPVTGATPVTAIVETAQYGGTVTWNPNHATFAASTAYTATVTLTAKEGFTFNGVSANFFTVAGGAATNTANSGTVTAVFLATGPGASSAYAISFQNGGHGTATADPNPAEAGETVTISAVPSNGYSFQGWQVVSGSVTLSPNATTTPATFTMPDSAVTITALFEELPPNTPNLSLSPVHFDTVTVGYVQPAAQTVTITNTGTGPATVSGIALSGANAASFTLNNTSITTIAANGGTESFTVQPNAGLAVGTYTAVITATYDDGKTATDNITFAVFQQTSIVEVVLISAGEFTMGSSDSNDSVSNTSASPPHQVTLTKGFYMGKYEVTQAQYLTVMGSLPNSLTTGPNYGRGNNYPVYYVTWYDAVEFCNKLSEKEGLQLVYTISGRTPATGYPITFATVTVNWSNNGYRLPTEAEWEYACRAGTTSAYNTGDTISDDTGWYNNNSNSMTHEVGLKPHNAWGLYDMHGNVWEWCWDWYGNYPSNPQTDPVGPTSGTYREGRGGAWNHGQQILRSAYRTYTQPNIADNNLGFRLVRPSE